MGNDTIELRSQELAEHEVQHEHPYKIQRSRSQALKSSFIHILPVSATFGILQLSFRNVYWADADTENQRVELSALQLAAKAHEILILVSLSSMILHYTHSLMVAPQGMSFGLLEAAYSSGLSSNPWTIGSWEALKHLRFKLKNRDKRSEAKEGSRVRTWHLVVLLVAFAFLALFVGPASAITLIPQLGWWHRQDLIGPLQDGGYYIAPSFTVYVPTNLFPTEVDESRLPGSVCDDAAKDTNSTCPSARIAEVQRSFTVPNPGPNSKVQNATISLSEDDGNSRRMLYLQSDRKAAVTVPNYLLASFASLIRLPAFSNAGNYDLGGPFTVEVFANGVAPMDPLVGVDCNNTQSELYIREYSYELDGFPYLDQSKDNSEDVRRTASFDIRSVWSEDELKKSVNGTELVWKDMSDITKTPVLLGLMRHERNVSVCSVQSYWTSTSQWVLSTSNYDVASNFTFDDTERGGVLSTFGYPYSLNVQRIHIHENWVKTLNAVNGSTKVLDALLQFGITTIKEAAASKASNSTLASADTAYKYFEPAIAQILAKTIANGLSRIGAQYAADHFINGISLNELAICNEKSRWCSQGPWLASRRMPLAVTANTSREAPYPFFTQSYSTDPFYSWYNDSSPIMRSFPKPTDADENWTRIAFPVRKYGYAWAFQGITTYLSVALLCFHAAIVLVHVIFRVASDDQTFDFGGSLGSLLLLAMGDRGAGGGNMWTRRVAVVPYGNMAERNKFKLDVIRRESSGEEKVRRADPEEVMRLVSVTQFEGRESRYPSARSRV